MCKTSRGTKRQRPVSIDRRHFMARWQTSHSDTYSRAGRLPSEFCRAAPQPQVSGALTELDVLDSGAERTEKDGLVVCTILGVPFLSCGLREAGLPARVAKNENDRKGVGQIGLLDRRKAFRIVYEPLRLPQEDGHNLVAHRWVINDDKVPTLHIRARRRSAAATGTNRSIDAMLAFCRKCLGADFVSIFTYRGPAFRRLSERR